MAKKKKHAPPPPPGHPRGKKKKAAPRLVVDPALLEQAVARIKATRLGLGPHDRKHLGRDLGKRYVLEHSEGYQLKNILEADEAETLEGNLDAIALAVDPLGVAKVGLAKWIRGLLPETIDPLDERFAAGLIEGLRDTAGLVAERLDAGTSEPETASPEARAVGDEESESAEKPHDPASPRRSDEEE